jgi:hypothetical protein
MLLVNQSFGNVLSRLWWIIEQQRRRRRDGAPVVTSPTAPGVVTLNPQPDGVHYTMPALPAGAGSMILQKRDSNGVWMDCRVGMAGLAGGATGIDISGVYAARALLTLQVDFSDGGITPGIYNNMAAYGFPGDGLTVTVLVDGTGLAVALSQTETCFPFGYYQFGSFSVDMGGGKYVYGSVTTRVDGHAWWPLNGYDFDSKAVDYRAVNSNGGAAGAAASCTTSALPAVASVPTFGTVRPAAASPSLTASVPVTLPAYPARTTFFRARYGEPQDTGAPRGWPNGEPGTNLVAGQTFQLGGYEVGMNPLANGTWKAAAKAWNNYGGVDGTVDSLLVNTSTPMAPVGSFAPGGTV